MQIPGRLSTEVSATTYAYFVAAAKSILKKIY